MHSQTKLLASMPPPVTDFFDALNSADEDTLNAIFAQNALVNDQLRDFRGSSEIRNWIHSEVIGESMRADVTAVSTHFGDCIVTANVTGNFDTTGLPDPLELCFHFGLREGHVVTLYVMHKLPPQSSPEIRVPLR